MTTPTPSMTVQVAVGYVAGCGECIAAVEAIHAAALRDASVTGFTARPGKVHAHAVVEAPKALPVSDTNGSHPDDVQRAIFSEAEIAAWTPTTTHYEREQEVA